MRSLRSLALAAAPLLSLTLLAQQPIEPPCIGSELRMELLRRKEEDAAARNAQVEWFRRNSSEGTIRVADLPTAQRAEVEKLAGAIKAVDDANTAWLKELVVRDGWPGISKVCQDGALAAWLLAQHADVDHAFQKLCLDRMRAMPPGEVDPGLVAYLTDRVALAEGRKQVYGTQTVWDGEKGTRVPAPLEDPDAVDRRRAEMGLGPLAEYLEKLNKKNAPPPNP